MVQTDSWQHILRQSSRNVSDVSTTLGLQSGAINDWDRNPSWKVKIPQPYLDRIQPNNPRDPLLLQVLAQQQEQLLVPDFVPDPLQEIQSAPLPGVLHKYANRILLTLHGACAIHCRYCFRRHFPYAQQRPADWSAIEHYIRQDPQIQEVILSGGDPLLLDDQHLSRWCEQIASLPQIKSLRFHTRVPIVLPQRITDHFLAILDNIHTPITIVVHCNHPQELDASTVQSLLQLKKHARHVLNQSVLLAGINDQAETLAELSWSLHHAGVLPYYLHQLDPVAGAHHFQVERHRAIQLHQKLALLVPGFLLPRFVQEIPNAPYKVPVS